MEARLMQEMSTMKTSQSQKDDYLEKTLTQEMGAMEARQSQRSDYLEKSLDTMEKTLVREIAKSRYIMFAVMVAAASVVLALREALVRFLN